MDSIIYIILIDLITSISIMHTRKYSTSNKRLSKFERSKLIIKFPLNEIIIGLLLGDGHIQQRSINGNSRFIYGQNSLKKHHFNYFNHICDLFKPYLSKEYHVKENFYTDKRTNNTYSSVNFATLSLPCFNFYRHLFYSSNNIKIVPLNIHKLLTPRGLAYWIMDDGSLQNKGLHLNTYAFSNQEVLMLTKTLKNLFGDNSLKCTTLDHPKGKRIYIWEESMELIRNNLSQFMLEDMLYKINYNKSK